MDELDELTDKFVSTTERAVRLGFDYFEVHAVHGYFLSEFLSPLAIWDDRKRLCPACASPPGTDKNRRCSQFPDHGIVLAYFTSRARWRSPWQERRSSSPKPRVPCVFFGELASR